MGQVIKQVMDKVAPIAAILLGLLFVFFGLNHFVNWFVAPIDFTGQAEQFWDALYSTDYLSIVKGLEILGGVLLAIPKTRNLGIIILAPIIFNILSFKLFLQKGAFFEWEVIVIILLFTVVMIFGGKRFFKAILS